MNYTELLFRNADGENRWAKRLNCRKENPTKPRILYPAPLSFTSNTADWEKILVKHTSDKELVFKIYKELWTLHDKKAVGKISEWTSHPRKCADGK